MGIQEILHFLEAEKKEAVYQGRSVEIDSFSDIQKMDDHSIIWIKNKEYLTEDAKKRLQKHQNILVVCTEKTDDMENCIITPNPKEVYFSILKHFFQKEQKRTIDRSAVVCTDKIGKNVNIGPLCYVGEEVEIAEDVYIHANVVIEGKCCIGKGSEIFSGTVIGTDGFGYYRERGTLQKVPHFKGVVIGEYVEIGANTCIDRGCLEDTRIGNHVKIDNLCHIAHNVCIEDNCVITAGSVIAGSAKIRRGAYLAPGVIVKNQIEVENRAFLGMGAVVTKPVASEKVAAGVPAKVLRDRKKEDF